MFFYTLILSICCCFDSFNIGFSYGIKKTKFQNHGKLVFFITILLVSIISILLGLIIKNSLPNNISNILGTYIIIGLGFSFFIKNIINFKSKYKSFDLDNSNDIDSYEMFLLSLVLSLNSIYIGISCTLLGFNILIFPLLHSFLQLIFLLLGSYLGKKGFLINYIHSKILLIISGIFLIITGFSLLP